MVRRHWFVFSSSPKVLSLFSFVVCHNFLFLLLFADLFAGPVQFGGWPSWIEWPSWDDRAVLVQSAKLPPRNLIKLALVSLRSEAL